MGRATDIRDEIAVERSDGALLDSGDLDMPTAERQLFSEIWQQDDADAAVSERCQAALDGLSEPQRQLLGLRYGFGGEPPRSLQLIAVKFGVDVEDAGLMVEAAENRFKELLLAETVRAAKERR